MVDVAILLAFLICAITGIVKWPGLVPFLGLSYRNLPMAGLSNLHDWSGLIMSFLAFTHVVLHWDWIVIMTKKIFSKKKDKT
ncbi:MAG: DUF4405 domain-containing protein [archaeon]